MMNALHRLSGAVAGLVLLASCASAPEPIADALVTLPEGLEPFAGRLSEVVDTCRFVPLETRDKETFIGREIQTIRRHVGRYYVACDHRFILIFNADGSFVKRLDRRGQGPQEYPILTDMALDGDRLYVLGRHKICVYDLDGRHIATHTLKFNGLNLAVSGDRCYVRGAQDSFLRAVDLRTGEVTDLGIPSTANLRNGRRDAFFPCGEAGLLIQKGRSNEFCLCTLDGEPTAQRTMLLSDGAIVDAAREREMIAFQKSGAKGRMPGSLISEVKEGGDQLLCMVNDPMERRTSIYVVSPGWGEVICRLSARCRDDIAYSSAWNFLQAIDGSSDEGFIATFEPLELKRAVERRRDDGSAHYRMLRELCDRIQEDDNVVLCEFRFRRPQ